MGNNNSVIVIGAGAAGMMAALTAASMGAAVTLLDGMDRPGKKLLLTGNGRCNLTNLDPDIAVKYAGTGADLARKAVCSYGAKHTIGFFEKLGMLTYEKNGYVYPYTNQAGSVLESLLMELDRLHVKKKWNEKAVSVIKKDSIYQVNTQNWHYEADRVIIACGSRCLPGTGSDGSGYEIARQLGHRVCDPVPALTALTCKGNYFAAISGVRCRAEVTLFDSRTGAEIKKDSGELQWTKYGVSGIVIFQLSRHVSTQKNKKFHIRVNFLPEFRKEHIREMLCRKTSDLKREKMQKILLGLLPEKLVPVILKQAGISLKCTGEQMSDAGISQLTDTLVGFPIEVTGTRDYDNCQVCAGGVDCREIQGLSMESSICRGVYFAGEILDVDGPCGGYNLQWAWTSGYRAGCAAAENHR